MSRNFTFSINGLKLYPWSRAFSMPALGASALGSRYRFYSHFNRHMIELHRILMHVVIPCIIKFRTSAGRKIPPTNNGLLPKNWFSFYVAARNFDWRFITRYAGSSERDTYSSTREPRYEFRENQLLKKRVKHGWETPGSRTPLYVVPVLPKTATSTLRRHFSLSQNINHLPVS